MTYAVYFEKAGHDSAQGGKISLISTQGGKKNQI
jgi:hypothetical protein